MSDSKFTVQDVVLNAVDDPYSFLLGNAVQELLRYRKGQNIQSLKNVVSYVEMLIKLEESNDANS